MNPEIAEGMKAIHATHLTGLGHAEPQVQMAGRKGKWKDGLRDLNEGAEPKKKPFKDHGKALADRALKRADKELEKLRKKGQKGR